MSWWGDRRPPETNTGGQLYASGPLSDLGDVTGEAYRTSRVTYNLNAEQIAGEIVYDEMIAKVQAATGDNLQNPYRQSFREKWIDTLGPSLRSPYNPRRLAIVRGRDDFQLQYWKLQQQQIDMGVPYEERLPDFNFEGSVKKLVSERQESLADVSSRADGFDAFVGQMAGDFGAMATDPASYLVSAVPFGASRTVLGAAVKGAIGNAAIEAGLQAPIAQWHKDLGLDYTAGDAAMNVAFAGLFGGVLEGGGTALYWGARGTPAYRIARRNLEKLPEDHILRQALSGKRKDVIAAGYKLKDYFTPEGRLAFSLEEARGRTLDDVPEGASPRAHKDAVEGAMRAGDEQTPPPRVTERVESGRAELAPFLGDELADTPRGRDARDLARLADDAYAQVTAGRITPEQGAEISRLVPDGRVQREIAEDLAELGPMTRSQSRMVIAVGLEARAPDAAARAIGWEGPPPQRPQSLIDWVRAKGGIRSDKFMEGNARQLLGGDGRTRPGLLNEKTGTHLDLLARDALDEGFDIPGEDPEILLRMIDDELAGYPSYRIGGAETWRAYQEGIFGFDPREEVRAFADALRASPDPDRADLGTSFEDMLGDGDLTPDDIEMLRPRGDDPRGVADFRAEADAIDALRNDSDARAQIREEAESAFGPEAARIIADDPGTDDARVYLFQKTARDPGPGELTPITLSAIKEDAAVLREALMEAAACAAGYPMVEGALTVGGSVLLAGALSGLAAGEQEKDAAQEAEGRADRARRAAEAADPKRPAREAARKAHEKHKAIAFLRTQAHNLHTDFRKDTLALWAGDLDQMPDFLPQYRVNAYVEGMTGVRADFLDALISQESAGDWAAQNPDSTATGGGQFIDGTWRRMMREYGPKYGRANTLGATRDAEKSAVMALRTDPRWGTAMVAEYALENARALEQGLGRAITHKEGYLAHFLGSGGALKLLKADPSVFAAEILPAAAGANQNVFYHGGDLARPRTAGEVISLQGRKFSSDPLRLPGWRDPRGEAE